MMLLYSHKPDLIWTGGFHLSLSKEPQVHFKVALRGHKHFVYCSLKRKHRTGLIQTDVLRETSGGSSPENNQWNALLVASGRSPESTTCLLKFTQTHTAQRYQIPVLAPGRFELRVPIERAGGGGEVVEEVRLRSMFDTDLNPQLSVRPFQSSNNTGAKRRKWGLKKEQNQRT